LTFFIALAIGAILLVLGLALYLMSQSVLLAGIEDTVRSRANAAADTIESGEDLSSDDDDDDQLILDGVAVIVRDENGEILETVNLPARGKTRDQVWREADRLGKPASGTAVFSGDNDYYVHAVPVDPPSGPARVVEAGRPYEPVEETLEVLGTVLVVGIGAAFLLSIGGAYLLARTALKPIDAVTSAAREMGEGDLSKRLPVANPKDEVGRLVTTVNGLLSRLEAAFARREEALEAQRRFAADASHELRTPLTAISGHARMLDEWALDEDPERARRSVGAIRREAGRIRNLVESLLALTRGDEGAGLEIGRHDLAAVAEEVVQAARDASDGKVSVECVTPGHGVEAAFDRGRVLQVVSILLDNAIRYTPEGGRIAIGLREDEGVVALEVSDTGIGIAEDQLSLVFDRFYRTDPSRTGDGAGLGLSIARQIAEAHGGEIRAKSTPGKGSTFTFLLPRRPPTPLLSVPMAQLPEPGDSEVLPR
jgi:two-component system OmpR family sensor kinase